MLRVSFYLNKYHITLAIKPDGQGIAQPLANEIA